MIFKKREIKKEDDKLPIKFYDLIKKPIITEKGTLLSNNSQIVFSIPMNASKTIVKQAVEKLFGVNVKKINIIISKGKTKRFKGKMGKRKNEKKAIISLEEGQKIDITTGI
ncbi:MAG: 50S ribosomal protein L23 [Pelagibacteraceae bacterium]|nr:50S ribosomal protein L23 [Pelagibacteraceae bacterium]|tara:strand:+ start:701 stop:1033 length:333 start_codon:yes stop_codon:yes gene_type:complete